MKDFSSSSSNSESTPSTPIANSEDQPHSHAPHSTAYQKWLATNPICSFLLFFTINLSTILISIFLQLNGVSVINGDKITQIGLEIPEDNYQMRANAYEAAKLEADFGLSGIKCPRSEVSRATLQMILETTDGEGNLLTQANLAKLEEMEDFFVASSDYKEKCSLLWTDAPTCDPENGLAK